MRKNLAKIHMSSEEIETILVTGANGLLGRAFCDFIRPYYSVIGVDLAFSGQVVVDTAIVLDLSNSMSCEQVTQIIDTVDYVVHFCGLSRIDDCNHEPSEAVAANVLATANLLDAVVKVNNVKKTLIAGSYYAGAGAGGFYGATKKMQEDLALQYKATFGLDVEVVRIGSVFVGLDDPNAGLHKLVRSIFVHDEAAKGIQTFDREYYSEKLLFEVLISRLDGPSSGVVSVRGAYSFSSAEIVNLVRELSTVALISDEVSYADFQASERDQLPSHKDLKEDSHTFIIYVDNYADVRGMLPKLIQKLK
jgi:nucleoside-diphosphate-sugar epimerase